MKILLAYPRWDYPTFGQLQEPLGIMCVAATLKAAGHEPLVVDLAVDPIEDLDAALVDAGMVGVSSSTALYGRACRVLDRIRQRRPGLPVVIGGPHATVLPEQTLARGFDAVALGEGEHTAVDMVAAKMPASMTPTSTPGSSSSAMVGRASSASKSPLSAR